MCFVVVRRESARDGSSKGAEEGSSGSEEAEGKRDKPAETKGVVSQLPLLRNTNQHRLVTFAETRKPSEPSRR